MRLGTKTILVLSGVIALSTALNFIVVRETVYPSFAELEKQKAKENIGRVVQSIDNEIKHLNLLNFDWAAWNDTYEFVVDQNPDYAESNLVWTSFTGSKLNLIHFSTTDRVVSSGVRATISRRKNRSSSASSQTTSRQTIRFLPTLRRKAKSLVSC